MNILIVLSFLLTCCLCQVILLPEGREGTYRDIRSQMTNNSFEFKVYKDHPTYDSFTSCFESIHQYYKCEARKRAHRLMDNYAGYDYNDPDMKWFDTFISADMMKTCLAQLPNESYASIFLYVKSARAFSTALHERASPGIWACYMDYMVKDYNAIRDMTEDTGSLYSNNQLITLYSGVADSVSYNITDEEGKLSVAENGTLTVTGYLSTTTKKDFAIMYGQGGSVAPRNPVILFVKPLATGSKAAFLDLVIGENGQYEMLFPTNVKFKIANIYDRNDERMDPDVKANNFLYELWLEETETPSIQTEVDGADPKRSEYVCEDNDDDDDDDDSSESVKSSGSGSVKSYGSNSVESSDSVKSNEKSESSKKGSQSVDAASRPMFAFCSFFAFLFIYLKVM